MRLRPREVTAWPCCCRDEEGTHFMGMAVVCSAWVLGLMSFAGGPSHPAACPPEPQLRAAFAGSAGVG